MSAVRRPTWFLHARHWWRYNRGLFSEMLEGTAFLFLIWGAALAVLFIGA